MSIIFSTVQFILNNILQDLEIQNLTNHLKFETLPYFSQIRAITKPEISTFDGDAEVQKVETSKMDNLIVSSYGIEDNSLTNEVFKRKNAFKPRINSYVNPMPKIKDRMNFENNNPSVMFIEDDYMDIYGLGDESILSELTKLENEEALQRIQRAVMNDDSHISLSSSASDSNSHSHSSLDNRSNSQNNLSYDKQNDEEDQNNESNANINNNTSQSYVHSNSVHSSTTNVDVKYSTRNISNSNNNMSNSNRSINESGSHISQSNRNSYNSNPEINPSRSYDRQSSGSSVSHSYSSVSSQSQSQESIDYNNDDHHSHSRSHSNSIIASNSILHTVNEYFVNTNADPIQSMESIPENALIFPEVADGQTLEIIQ